MSKRLIKITNTRPNSSVNWWWEAWDSYEDPNVRQSANNYEEVLNVLSPNRFPHAHRLIWSPTKESLECYQYWYFNSLPDPAPKFLLDWYFRENRYISLQILESSDQEIKSYLWWSVKYRQENNILINNIEVVNSNEVEVWPTDT